MMQEVDKNNGGDILSEKRVSLSHWFISVFVALLCGWFFNRLALDSDLNWTTSMYMKKMAIAGKPEEPRRILLIGGSGVHYSLDAMLLEQETGIFSVNMGLHAGLGLNAILAGVRGEIRKGDIIILIPEYGLLEGEGVGWLSAAYGVAIAHPGIGGVGVKQKAKEILLGCSTNLTSLGKSIWRVLFGIGGKASYAIGERGSAVDFMEGSLLPSNIDEDYMISDHALRELKRFDSDVRDKGAMLLFVLPWFLIKEGDVVSGATLRKAIRVIRTISHVLYDENTLNLQMDSSLFSDSMYHPNPQGRRIATESLVKQLKNAGVP